MAVIVVDDRLLDLVDADVEVEQITTGYVFTEGPVWHSRERHLTFSDIFDEHGGTQYRWSEEGGAQILRRPSNHANGSTYDRLGRLITCEHDRRLVRIHPDGTVESLAERHGDARLNSPNDVIRDRHSDDLIFTDPPYGLRDPEGNIVGREYGENAIFRLRASTGELQYLTGDLETPNGLVMTDDGSTLIVADTAHHVVYSWDVQDDGSLANRRLFSELRLGDAAGGPDGMKLDVHGNLYVAGGTAEGVWVFDPQGTLLGCIGVGPELNRRGTGPGGPANLCWGGDDWQTMFATTVRSVYRFRMKVAGQPVVIE